MPKSKQMAIRHFEAALAIASVVGWCDQLFWIRLCLARLFFRGDKFDDSSTHIERARSHAFSDPYKGRGIKLQADVWHKQGRPEDAKFEALGALEKLGAATDIGIFSGVLRKTTGRSDGSGGAAYINQAIANASERTSRS